MLTTANPGRLEDYGRWHAAQVTSGDIDPMYPVLDSLARRWGLSREERAWLVFLHVAWYHPGSTIAAFQRAPSIEAMPRTAQGLDDLGLLSLPTGTERRGHRSTAALVSHLLKAPAYLREHGGYLGWIDSATGGATGTTGWSALFDAHTQIPGDGRWAAYKSVEMLQKVVGVPITAADAGHRYSSGPRKGLADLVDIPTTSTAADVATLDRLTLDLAHYLGEPDIAQVETSLCDFHSLVKGRYYLGHDIDSMQGAWMSERLPRGAVPQEAWDARAESFSHRLLGEANGWWGVRKHRMRLYRDQGVIE